MPHLLLVLNHSTDRPKRAMTALLAGRSLAAEGHEIRLWLQNEGVRLGIRGVAETLHEPGAETAAEALDGLVAGGAEILCSRRCFEIREFEASALRPGASLVDPTELGRLASDGWIPLGM